MTDASTALHEPLDELSERTMENRRGLVTLLEEFEAIDWYQQRIDATKDPQLKSILAHNRDEEKEHAMMALEWLRRRDPILDEQMRGYLFTQGSLVAEAADAAASDMADTPSDTPDESVRSLDIGSLRGGF